MPSFLFFFYFAEQVCINLYVTPTLLSTVNGMSPGSYSGHREFRCFAEALLRMFAISCCKGRPAAPSQCTQLIFLSLRQSIRDVPFIWDSVQAEHLLNDMGMALGIIFGILLEK